MKNEEIWSKWSMEIAKMIREYMRREGLDRSAAASRLGVSPQYMSKVLSGNTNFSLKNIAGIGEGLGMGEIISLNRRSSSYDLPSAYSTMVAEPPATYISGEAFETNENVPAFVYRTEMTMESNYVEWLSDIKSRFVKSQAKAAVAVNKELLEFYWGLGRDMVSLQAEEKWGAGFMSQFSLDMKNMFPGETGFSATNLKYIKRWYLFYYQGVVIGHQLGDQLEMPPLFCQVPWRHHIEIVSKASSIEEAVFYLRKVADEGWSRSQLESQIKSNLYKRQGSAITNFKELMSVFDGECAQQILKDPYNFEFLTLNQNYDEKTLEDALVSNITNFLLELGKGFAFVGRQMELRMTDGKSYFPDLVFYHTKLKSYVVVELKTVDFKPEFAGKINFYISAADELLRGEEDNPSIGLIICKSSDKTVVEWSLRGIDRPLGVASYQLQEVVERTVKEIESRQ